MKSMSRILALLMALVMVFALASCASEPATTPDAPATTDTPATPAETPSEEPADDPAEEPVDEPATDEPAEEPVEEPAFVASATPFVDEVQPLTAYIAAGGLQPSMNVNNFNDNLAFQELEARTNVHVEFTHAPESDTTTAFNLMLASEDYDDMFVGVSTLYPQGTDYYVEEEIIIDLAPYLNTYAADYGKVLAEDNSVRLAVTTDEGRVPLFRTVNYNIQPSYLGYVTNQAYLDAVGISELPETVDEFEAMLAALHDGGYGSVGTMYLNSGGFDPCLMSAFDVETGFMNVNGKAVYGPTSQAYYQYLETVADWNKKGYIDTDFVSRIHSYVDFMMLVEGDVAVYPLMKAMITTVDGMWAGTDPSWTTTILPNPRAVAGTPTVTSVGCVVSRMSYQSLAVTTACENPELAVQWGNYFYTEEGALLANYGILNESYEMLDGEPMLTEFMYANPDGQNMGELLNLYTLPEVATPRLYAWERYDTPDTPEKVATTDALWFANFDLENWQGMPDGLARTPEENETYSNTMNDISTYMEEYSLLVMSGENDLASTWEGFIADCEAMGLAECTAIQQAALDRVLSR